MLPISNSREDRGKADNFFNGDPKQKDGKKNGKKGTFFFPNGTTSREEPNNIPFLMNDTNILWFRLCSFLLLFSFSSPLLVGRFLVRETVLASLRRDGAGGRGLHGRRRRGGGGGRGRRVAVRAAAVEPALEGAGVRRRRADALGAGPMSAAAGRRRGGGRPAPPHLRRRRRAGRRRAAAVVAVAVEPAFLPSSVHVVGRHYSLLSVVLHTIKDGFNERLITRSLCHKRC